MTDDDINKRVAEIKGWSLRLGLDREMYWMDRDQTQARRQPPPYATDWAWCGPLVEKYRVTVDPVPDKLGDGVSWDALIGFEDARGGCADTPQRAICLAVIAAHQQEPTT